MSMAILMSCGMALAQKGQIDSGLPDHFEIARHTFFDFGPPNDYYELFLVRSTEDGSSIERITLTPAGDVCIAPSKVETASTTIGQSVETILATANPCKITGKPLRRELKRCKNCLVFSGANVVMQIQCGTQTRLIRSDILDRDMFDPSARTPEHPSWTMGLLKKLDDAVGPGVMDKPTFQVSDSPQPHIQGSQTMRDIGAGKYDKLFHGAPDKPSDLYRDAHTPTPVPTIRLVRSVPFSPQVFAEPAYPPLARLAHVEGVVSFRADIGPTGVATNLSFDDRKPLLHGAVEKAVSGWKFPLHVSNQQIHADILFALNCPQRVGPR
jgi:hypothetical protein